MHARGRRADRVGRAQSLEDLRRRAGRDELPAPRARAPARLDRARRRPRLRRARAASRPCRRDCRPRLERQHAAHERLALDRACSSSPRPCSIGPPGADDALHLAGVFRSVVDARGARYLMLNAPEDALEAICALVPGSRAPSVLPLAEPGMVAVHSVIPAADVWQLLPALEAAGASSILLVPRRADARMTGVAEIVADVRARGDEARARLGARASTASSPRARPPRAGFPRTPCSRSRTACAAGTRRSGRATCDWRSSRASSSSGAGCRSVPSASTSRAGSSRRSSCARCRRTPPASSASSS